MSIKKHMEGYANLRNFRISVSPKEYFDLEAQRLPYKGFFYCSPLSENREKGLPCPFQVYFRWNKMKQHYAITLKETQHSHALDSKIIIIDGRVKIRYQRDLTEPESVVIEQLSTCKITVPMICVNMERIFPGRSFDPVLITNMRKNYLDRIYGADRHNLPALAEMSEEWIREGGVFSIVPSADGGILSIHAQHVMWKDYAMRYGPDGPKMVDGSHKYSMYRLETIPWTLVDCLFRSKIVGVTYNLSENSDCKILFACVGEVFRHSITILVI
jgi:hypothetical protein